LSPALVPVIAATTQWLLRAYPPSAGTLNAVLAEAQARQATTVAAWLRYPTAVDVALVDLVGPGGSARLDWLLMRGHPTDPHAAQECWRTWVDEVVASWATCLLAETRLAEGAVAALNDTDHLDGRAYDFARLTAPDARDERAAILLRHPDLVAPVASLHRDLLVQRLLIAATGSA
jgi:hypothetical protein